MSRRIDLNADLGEEVTDDAALLAIVSSANLACGFHAGTEQTMAQVCRWAAEQGVRVGAQVSYDDREGFGRRPRDVAPGELAGQVAVQVAAVRRHAAAAGIEIAYLKPHGALYHRVVDDEEQAGAVLRGSGRLPVLGLPGGALLRLARAEGREVYCEGFADRALEAPDAQGVRRLRDRALPGAVLTDPALIAAAAVRLAEDPGVDSICVHGDNVAAVAAAKAARTALEEAGYSVGHR